MREGKIRKQAKGTIEVNQTEYIFAHGSKPKGFGNWAFKLDGMTHWFGGMYSKAEREAIRKAWELKASIITVCP